MLKIGTTVLICTVVAFLLMTVLSKLVWILIPIGFFVGIGLVVVGAVAQKSIGPGNRRSLP
jgi:hypothetical protein